MLILNILLTHQCGICYSKSIALAKERPMNLQQFEEQFGTDKQCFEYLFAHRFSSGFRCNRKPGCIEKGKLNRLTDSKFRCSNCRHQYSLRVGSMFEGSRIPINKWFRAIWLISTQKCGTSGLWLQKELELGSYPTAFKMLQEIRFKMRQEKLQGTVFVEVYKKVKEMNEGFDLESDYAIIAVEVEGTKMTIEKICMRKTECSDDDIVNFLKTSVEQGSTVVISNHVFWYDDVSDIGYTVKTARTDGGLLQPVSFVVSHLQKEGLIGIKQDYCSNKQADVYSNECCFKFNNRNPRKRFYKLLDACCKFSSPE